MPSSCAVARVRSSGDSAGGIVTRGAGFVVPDECATVICELANRTRSTASQQVVVGQHEVRLGIVCGDDRRCVLVLTGLTQTVASVVAFYPGLVIHPRPGFQVAPVIDRIPGLRAPTLVIIGSADQGIPASDIDQLRGALGQIAARHEVTVYPGADHGFHSDDRPQTYHAEVAAAAWTKTVGWFAETVGSSGPPGHGFVPTISR